MSSPLRSLFEHHLASLNPSTLKNYLEFNGLDNTPSWTDDQGRCWTLPDRLVELALTGTLTRTMGPLLARVLPQSDSKVERWDRVDEEERRRRVRLWLAVQRLEKTFGGFPSLRMKVEPLFKTSFAGRPEGFPASGFGEKEDGGWLHYAFEELGAARDRSDSAGQDWSGVALCWLESSLLGQVTGSPGPWWRYGGVSKTYKNRFQVGDPGWEIEGSLPVVSEYAPLTSSARPRLLPAHWKALVVRLVDLAADSLERSGRFDCNRPFRWLAAEPAGAMGAWLSDDLKHSLARLAQAGLVRLPSSDLPHRRFDGASLGALSLLVREAPDGHWVSSGQRHALAQAVVGHQRAWEESPLPHVRMLSTQEFAPAQSPCFAWAQALVQSPRPSRPGLGARMG